MPSIKRKPIASAVILTLVIMCAGWLGAQSESAAPVIVQGKTESSAFRVGQAESHNRLAQSTHTQPDKAVPKVNQSAPLTFPATVIWEPAKPNYTELYVNGETHKLMISVNGAQWREVQCGDLEQIRKALEAEATPNM